MNYYYYSASQNAFYPYALKRDYVKAGSWPDAGIDVEEAVFEKYTATPPDGKHRVAGADGLPTWGDIPPAPPPTPEELQQQAESQKWSLIQPIRGKIEPLQDAVYLNIATDEEKIALTEWHRYRLALYRVDCSTAPDINWPEQPK
ncbi:tail fiber assembly protein [Xenorhabdus bovienii]|uniref:Putative tail fiber assembly protein n=1 Tax=Xenorhabdus bovienii str. Intermedium TaxID=1379677 RepID=A0A077QDF9_XENBV|nr:tail fiber assembly protein [Xenorhabdus bovienii]CDH31133.1 putative tail fiber assembly protein [Xenorhabdus bovienii str. Intermedium]